MERHHSDFFASLSTIGVDITELKQKHESREELLPRHDTEFTFQDSDRYAQTEQSYKPRWWDKGYLLQELWTSSWNMYLFLLVGICFAIGHHVYYRSLEKMIVYNDEQLTTLRYGTALAFAAKASLVAAVLLAFREQIWYTCSTKFLRVTTLNDMFAAPETPLSLLNLEFLWKAKIPAALVLYCWLSPLSVILTTSTLIAVPSQEVHNTTCPGVRTLNFRFEDNTNWRNGGKIASLDQQSLSWWNETSKDEFDPNFFDYYTSMSDNAKELLQASTYLQRPIFDQDNTFEVCERGWNCTVEISFVGPTYNCSTISRGVGGAEGPGFLQQENGKSMIPFNMSMLAPVGNFTYIAQTMHGEYAYPQMDAVFSGGIPKMAPPFPAHLGVFRTEPIIWIGYAEMNKSYNATEFQNRTTDVRNSAAFTPVVIACEHYEANYTAEIAYRDGMQIPTIKSKKLISPIINTTYVPELEANDGTMDKTVAVPQSNYIFPRDLKTYRRTAGYHSMGLFLRRKLNGTIQGAGLKEDSQVLYTSLIDHRFHFVRRNIIPLIEAWYGNLLMSMFARPRFQAVVWAARTDEQTGTRKTGFGPESDYLYSCTRSRPAVRYHYRTRILVSVYGILIFLALLGVTAGAVAIRRNGGVSKGTGFSNIVEATRGPTLDRMDWGEGKEYGPVKIGYGLLRTQDGDLKRPGGEILVSEPQSRRTNSRFGFGFEGDVDQLKPERRTSEEREAAVGP
ncbi:hypothetical protein CkaCkLH20_06063 [Colletotrichum karsti]|uniref:Uncharacterized protein n=1 Tax=Colletotrichum karsti TaxID=1095194 RepID=A0A9P6IDG0_9PEZI|nr:uncharacterized protein CkaCkLH20_06063 [Colletotrichum karsti]KAF9876655.1 hypothetical protein CkaCkLH20_06063 [Colletotrichum karsti]